MKSSAFAPPTSRDPPIPAHRSKYAPKSLASVETPREPTEIETIPKVVLLFVEQSLEQEQRVMISAFLIVVLVTLFIMALPAWSYSRDWGYVTAGIVGASLLFAFGVTFTASL